MFVSLLTRLFCQSNKLSPEGCTASACSQLPQWPHAFADTTLRRVPAVATNTKLRDTSEQQVHSTCNMCIVT